ncbi:hypothetical protein DY000_02037240 [Brassica cretica]|uniref:Uncharacterized protein n=1 Tax=Brassica cretica TaxID=69181 RepID=A0ABQ7BHB0_BRACR|nr:hypothetical protein DY000_02037240 [Brassica cretica]
MSKVKPPTKTLVVGMAVPRETFPFWRGFFSPPSYLRSCVRFLVHVRQRRVKSVLLLDHGVCGCGTPPIMALSLTVKCRRILIC